ncbi:MAG TPA: sulfotransferase [Rubrobacteraceae bacterium]|nr:sulfotransferase [Rubrobacteraceae bacterium]
MPDFKDRLTSGVKRIKTRLGRPEPPRRTERPVEPAPEAPNGARPFELLQDAPPTFFIVGRAKSGTSWLMRILNSHPDILCRGEGKFFGRQYMRDNQEQVKLQPTSLYGAIADSEYLRAWVERSVWAEDEDVEEHLANLTSLATNYFLARRLSKVGKRIVGDKTPFTGMEVVEEIKEIRPDAKLIHIIRDGRDVAISAIHHMWNHARHEGGIHDLTPEELAKREAYRSDPQAFLASGESIFTGRQLYGTAKNWAEMVRRAMEDGPKLLGENYTEVRYEDLLEEPEPEVRRLLGFLDADAREPVVNRCIERASFERRTKGRERGQEDSKDFMRKGIAGDWKNVFNEEDKRAFKEAAGDLLVELGYEENQDW